MAKSTKSQGRKWMIRVIIFAISVAAVYAINSAQPKPEPVTSAATVPEITTDTAPGQETVDKGIFEAEPEFHEAIWDTVSIKITQPPYKYIAAGLLTILVSFATFITVKRGGLAPKRKSKLTPRWSNQRSALISVILVGAGGLAVWQVLAAVPGQYASTWSKHLPIRVANFSSGVSSGAFHGAISRWNTLARKTVLTASTNSPMIRVRAGSANARASYARRYGANLVCDIWLAPGHKNSSTVLGHEIGHCLGYTDHVPAGQWRGSWTRVCDATSHSYYSPYKGVMSYCSILAGSNLFGSHDQEALRAYGYTTANSIPTPSGGSSSGGSSGSCTTKGDTGGSHPTLRKGSTGSCVQHAEYILSRIAHYDVKKTESPGKIDTVFDTATYNAVRNYQARKKLAVDGVIGYNTWRSLHGACAYINRYLKNNYRC